MIQYFVIAMKKHFLSTTDDYHKREIDSLGWEITLSVMLEDPRSACRDVLLKGDSFGNLLYDFLVTAIPMDKIHRIIEVGGGYGYLMRDFLRRNNTLCATMIDLSPFLLAQQQESLQEFAVKFVQGDFLKMKDSVLSYMDLAILNEVIGDFPTACTVPKNVLLEGSDSSDPLLRELRRIYKSYDLLPPASDIFTINLGAIQAIEKLCCARIP